MGSTPRDLAPPATSGRPHSGAQDSSPTCFEAAAQVTGNLPGLFDADADDELPLANPRAPGLGDDDPIERGLHRPRGLVEALEVVQPPDYIDAADASPAGDDLLVMAVVRGGDVASGIHD